MKILLANPPAYLYNDSRHFIQAGSRWSFSMIDCPKDKHYREHYLPYPFFLGYASSLLKRELSDEVKIRAVDFCALDCDEKEFLNFTLMFKPDIIVTEIPTLSFPLFMKTLAQVKEKLPYVKIFVAGPHISALYNEVLQVYNFIDVALIGEYEVTLLNIIKILVKKGELLPRDLGRVRGVAFKLDNNRTFFTGRMRILNLDELPFPDREDFDIKLYHDFEITGKPTIQMLASRGCPFNCSFCISRHVIYNNSYYVIQDLVKILEEMNYVKYKLKAKQVYFDDETMVANKKFIRKFCQLIIKEKLDLPWACMGDVTLDYDTLKLMTKAGCVGIKFGVETISSKALNMVHKSFINVSRVIKFREWCRRLGLWTHATYMIGLPGDTIDGILATIKFSLKLNTESAQFSIATPFPGTPFFELCKHNNWLITYDWTMYDGANFAVVSYPCLPKEIIEALHKFVNKTWEQHMLWRAVRDPNYAIRALKGRSPRYIVHRVTTALKRSLR